MAATRLGEILRDEGMISDLQLAESLQVQKEERSRIGDILVDLGYLTKRQLRHVIREYKRRIPLGEYLLERGLITPDDLDFALSQNASSHQPLGQILTNSQIITEEQLAEVLSEQLDMPYIVPYQRLVDRRVFSRLPADFMRHHNVLPLTQTDGVTTVLVPGLIDESTSLQLERVFGQDVDLAICTPSKIEETINFLLDNSTMPEIREFASEAEIETPQEYGRMDMGAERIRELGTETQAVDLVNYLVNEAIKDNASDIHLESMPDRVQVRFRTNGIIHHKTDLPLGIRDAVFRRVKVMAGLDISETRKDQEGRLMGHLENMKVDLRVSVFVGTHGEALNLRIFRQDVGMMDLGDLGMTPNTYTTVRRALDSASGMFVFAGPPASGKTTSMYAALNYLNKKDLKIVTVEDPVEYDLTGAIQGELSAHRGLSLAEIVGNAIHQDPDVIAVGEVPHDDQAREVLSAALTGHKMLTTLHADDTVGSLLRLIDSGLPTFLRSSTALTVICQRLVRKICPGCRTDFTPDPLALRQFPIREFDADKYDFCHGKGCAQCQNTGFYGRTGLFEVLKVNDEVREAFIGGATSAEILAIARSTTPFLTMNEVGFLKIIRRVTTVDEVLRVAPLVSLEREMKNPLTVSEIERISERSGVGFGE